MNCPSKEHLAQVLRDAKSAHAEHEKTLGHPDDQWSEWYAEYIINVMKTAGDSESSS